MGFSSSSIDELEAQLKNGPEAQRTDIPQHVTNLFLLNAEFACEEHVGVFRK